jgi:hypothetical protein
MIFAIKQPTTKIRMVNEVPFIFLLNAHNSGKCDESLFSDWFKPVYTRSSGLKKRTQKLFKAFKQMSKVKRQDLIDILNSNRNVKSICDSSNSVRMVSNLDLRIQKPLTEMFTFLYENTIDSDIFKKQCGLKIKDHYRMFIDENEIHVCPFCGLESYSLPEHRRAEYDHYLPISIYPWLGVNFDNLVPMGDICNGRKNQTNVLFSDKSATIRRFVWHPSEWIDYSTSLDCVKKPSLKNPKGEWNIKFTASGSKNQSKVETWDSIFNVTNQYSDAISTYHKSFLKDFVKKNKLFGQRLTISKLKEELKNYKEFGIGDVKLETMANLKAIWSEYYIQLSDTNQFVPLIQGIANSRQLPKP